MGYRYFALVGIEQVCAKGDLADELLANAGMEPRLSTPAIKLFCSAGTPISHLHDGSVLVGHAFGGAPQLRTSGALATADPAQTRRHLLDHRWGEYLLIQPAVGATGETCFLRDPSGGVDCVYAFAGNGGFATSDISLAISLGLYTKTIDWDVIAHLLCHSTEKSHRAGLAGVQELLPGHCLCVSGGETSVHEEWTPWTFVAPDQRFQDFRQATDAVSHAVARVVTTWAENDRVLMLELSGGLDSSIIASCLKGVDAVAACCNVTTPFPGTDERPYARQMADLLGADLLTARLAPEDMALEFQLPRSAVSPAIAPLQHALDGLFQAKGNALGVDCFYTGAGGDTVFAALGNASPAADAFLERGLGAAAAAVRNLSTLHRCTFWKAAKLTLRKVTRGSRGADKANQMFLDPSVRDDDLARHPWLSVPQGSYPGDRERIADLASTQVFRDGATRATTRWLRMPLLSQPVMEQCLRVPTWMSIADGQNRAVARQAFAGLLPPDIRFRRSKATLLGFLGSAFERQRSEIREFLLGGSLSERRLLDARGIDAFTTSALPPRDESFVRLYELCKIENWLRQQ
ncbi:asparagine synthase-related protein [Luteimonas sp. SDU82]|uniref:asparagine synthase-related protein n=1 Tax=Luteimonas sp. SDU82 TaxID=3422592 RepID=UPI003EBC92BC